MSAVGHPGGGTGFSSIACASIAVPSIERALQAYRDGLGLDVVGGLRVSPRNFGLRWVELGRAGASLGDGPFIELLEPTGEGGPVDRFLERTGPGVYQLRLVVDDLPATVAELRGRSMNVILGEQPPGEPRAAWIHPRSTHGVLFELMEPAAR
jgi:methylmalonyl-CoA/ethylmalonyl-CoA epimerase